MREHSLPSLTQQAVCNQDIVLPKYVFVPFWGDGTWFYKYVREAAQLQITSGTNDTGACPQKKSDAGVAGTKTLAIVGGVLGGVILVLSGTLAWCGFKLFQLRRENERRDLASEPYAPSPVSQAQRPQSAVTFAQYSPVEMHSPSPVPQSAPQLISPPQPQPPQPQHQTQSHSQYISSRPIKSAYPAPPNLQDHSPSPLEHRSRVAGPRPPLRSATSNSTSGGSSGSPSHESRSGSARASLLPPSYYVR
ncbi:hypothetical protein FRC09_000140 [Ceratobasidium sp. 395]|nr:hypothetical protein FRC09_000140 [Ceratobasidium sp. 395]